MLSFDGQVPFLLIASQLKTNELQDNAEGVSTVPQLPLLAAFIGAFLYWQLPVVAAL